jgi:hypothetical protein
MGLWQRRDRRFERNNLELGHRHVGHHIPGLRHPPPWRTVVQPSQGVSPGRSRQARLGVPAAWVRPPRRRTLLAAGRYRHHPRHRRLRADPGAPDDCRQHRGPVEVGAHHRDDCHRRVLPACLHLVGSSGTAPARAVPTPARPRGVGSARPGTLPQLCVVPAGRVRTTAVRGCRELNAFSSSYLYTVLVVAFGESIESATRITNVYSFTSVLVGVGLGFVVRYVRYLKPL